MRDFSIIVDDEGEVMFQYQSTMGKAVARARQQIMEQEDAEIFRILDSLTSGNNDI